LYCNRRIDGIWHCCFKKNAAQRISSVYNTAGSNCWGLSGATSAEVEAQLTKVVENYILDIRKVRKEKNHLIVKGRGNDVHFR